MLPSLHIEGFRCFRKLTIERLGRVTLIVGKNNVGKTTLLDALRVHAAQDDAPYELEEMLDRRGEIVCTRKSADSTRRVVDWPRAFHDASVKDGIAALFVRTCDEVDGTIDVTVRMPPAQAHGTIHASVMRGTRIEIGAFSVDQPLPPRRRSPREIPCQYIPASGLSAEEVSRLWDGIVLTEHEDTCLQALRIIEPDIQRVALVEVPGADGGVERSPHVSRASRRQPEPLHSLGEGMSRVFEIMLGMTNARGGRLLIDEIENGLHYSIHEEMWRYVFRVADMLDVQVFATTHSWGCIEAFQAAEREHPGEGILIRLERRNDETRAFLFGEEKLAVVAEQGVEVR
jgi:predicted ATPase